MQEEQRGRRAISGLTEPVSRSRKKLCTQIDVTIPEPVSTRINYDSLDSIGHGMRVKTATATGPQRTAQAAQHPQQQQQHQQQQQQAMGMLGRASPPGMDTSGLYESINYGTVAAPTSLFSTPVAPPSVPQPGANASMDIYDSVRGSGPAFAPPSVPVVPAPMAPPSLSAPAVQPQVPSVPAPGPPTSSDSDNVYGAPVASAHAGPPQPQPSEAQYETIDRPDAGDDLYGVVLPSQGAPPIGQQDAAPAPQPDLEACAVALSIFDYDAEHPDELSFKEGEHIHILKKNDDGWYEGVIGDRRGLFPGNYCEEVEESDT